MFCYSTALTEPFLLSPLQANSTQLLPLQYIYLCHLSREITV